MSVDAIAGGDWPIFKPGMVLDSPGRDIVFSSLSCGSNKSSVVAFDQVPGISMNEAKFCSIRSSRLQVVASRLMLVAFLDYINKTSQRG